MWPGYPMVDHWTIQACTHTPCTPSRACMSTGLNACRQKLNDSNKNPYIYHDTITTMHTLVLIFNTLLYRLAGWYKLHASRKTAENGNTRGIRKGHSVHRNKISADHAYQSAKSHLLGKSHVAMVLCMLTWWFKVIAAVTVFLRTAEMLKYRHILAIAKTIQSSIKDARYFTAGVIIL